MTELIGLPYSPWSERARWALDVRKVPYRSRTYSPLLGEPELRLKLRRPFGVVSVPVLVTDDGAIGDSTAIARWADARGEGASLFPKEHALAIDRWVDTAERGLGAGRALSLHRLLSDRDGLLEMVPRSLRTMPGARTIAATGIRRTLRKYRSPSAAAARAELAEVLEELRAAIAKSRASPATLLGTFTYADVAMAQVLGFVSPPAFGLRLGKATRKNFSDDELRARFADVVAWRDALYETYRPRTER